MSIETDDLPRLLAGMRDGADGLITTTLGIELTGWSGGQVTGRMPVEGSRQPLGLLHGGANAVLAETLGSVAAALHAGPNGFAVGHELSCTHHRGVRDGWVHGVCTPLHEGDSTATYHIEITDDRAARTCTARLTCVVHRRRR